MQFSPGFTLRFSIIFKIPLCPLLKLITAEATPIAKVNRPTKTSLGHRLKITPFYDSLLFCVCP